MSRTVLSSEDWIKAAFRALTKGGPQAMKVEPIARELGVSKGSFYWHFAGLPALKTAMLDYWQQAATDEVIFAIDQIKGTHADKLSALINQAAQTPSDVGGASAEPAIYDWARYDNEVARAVKAVDQKRLAYLTSLFEDRLNAEVFYAAFLGLSYSNSEPKAVLDRLRQKLLC